MRKATCFILSLLILATPLFAIKEAVYNAQGVKVGYIEKVNGKTIYYDKNGFTTDRIDMQSLINKELDNIERRDRAYGKSVDPAMDAFNEAYERGLRQKRLENSSSSYSSPSFSSSSKSYKVCPLSYCKHNNSTSAKFCSQCAYSLENVSVTSAYSSPKTTSAEGWEQRQAKGKREMWWMIGICAAIGILNYLTD